MALTQETKPKMKNSIPMIRIEIAVSLRDSELTVTVEADMRIVYRGKDYSLDVAAGCWQDEDC